MKIWFTIIFLFSAISLYAQENLEQQYDYAVKLFEDEEYYDAVTEAKRLLFFDEENIYSYRAYYLAGESYKAGAKYFNAIINFRHAERFAENEKEIYNTRLSIIKCNILRRTTDRALVLLDSLMSDERFINHKDEIYYWKGWAYIFADEWDKAASAFEKINPNHELKLFSENVDEKKYSESFAKIASIILPGAGQIYTGNYLNGILSLGWNVLFGYLTINAFIEERVFDGLMVGNFLWFRFYLGNIQNAEKFTKEENLEITNDALLYLQNEYKGFKP